MSLTQRRLAAAILFAALGTAAVVLIAGGRPVVAFIAEVTGLDRPLVGSGAATTADGCSATAPPVAVSDHDDLDDPDRHVFADPAVRPLRVKVVDANERPAPGIPVVVLGGPERGGVLAGPKFTNPEGLVRFPIDLAMEREPAIVVAARAIPGQAASSSLCVAMGRAADVRLVVPCGIRALVSVLDPEGRPVAGARVRKAILGEPRAESGPGADAISAALAETTPRAVRTPAGLELAGFTALEECLLVASAPGFSPVYHRVLVPPDPPNPLTIELRLEKRTCLVRLEAALPAGIDPATASFSCHQHEPAGVVMAAGFDEAPAQKSSRFEVDVAADSPHRLEVHAWVGGNIVASGELEVPALQPGEVFDAGVVRLDLLPVVLAGHVVDQDQAPLQNATVEAIGRGVGRDLATQTGVDGTFSLRAPAGRGPYQVAAHAPGRVTDRLAGVVDPAKDLRLVLDHCGAIQGRVVVPPGVDADRISVRAHLEGRTPFATAPRKDGTFFLTGLPRGVYAVVIDGENVERIRVTDVVVAPPETTTDGRLDRVTLRALAAQGQP